MPQQKISIEAELSNFLRKCDIKDYEMDSKKRY